VGIFAPYAFYPYPYPYPYYYPYYVYPHRPSSWSRLPR
jgi:hypothetical protein